MTISTAQTARFNFERLAHGFLWIVTLAAICLVPLLILSHGYSPIDDALRHAAKAVSGKSWDEILVLADWVKTDHNPGWHFILGAVYRLTQCDVDTLLAFSMFFTFAVFATVPLIWLRRPEVWLATLLLGCFLSDSLLYRLMIGRPLVIAMTCIVALLLIWREEIKGREIPKARFIQSIVVIAIAAWVHGSWYLLCLPAVACAFSGRWRDAAWLALSLPIGALLGATLTGHPIVFLVQAVEIARHAMLERHISAVFSATEVLPSSGDKLLCVAAGIIVVWRVSRGATAGEVVRNPPFMLALICWILGLKVSRFWTDLGLPAFVCWSAIQLEAASISSQSPARVLDRCLMCLFAAAALVFSTTSDLNFRWSHNLYASDDLTEEDPQLSSWLPGPGGIFYNTGMSQFYRFFFKYPHGNWRYVLGFEPTFMTAKNLAIYENILKAPESPEPYQDWVRQMSANDRLTIVAPTPVTIKELEWHQLGKKTWIGRLRSVAH